jgi:hypothetical protein
VDPDARITGSVLGSDGRRGISLPARCNGDVARKSSAIEKFRSGCGGDDFSPAAQFHP